MSVQENDDPQPRRRLARWLPFRRGEAPMFGSSGRSDVLIAGAGLALAIGSAMFPWYVFLNQEQFGIRALKFEGRDGAIPPPVSLALGPKRIRQPLAEELPMLSLDFLATGTLPPEGDPPVGAVPLSAQPFPGQDWPTSPFRLVHVAAGRAMLEDDNGLWVVQIGSRLPDRSRVASIERRDGGWVVVTDRETVISLGD